MQPILLSGAPSNDGPDYVRDLPRRAADPRCLYAVPPKHFSRAVGSLPSPGPDLDICSRSPEGCPASCILRARIARFLQMPWNDADSNRPRSGDGSSASPCHAAFSSREPDLPTQSPVRQRPREVRFPSDDSTIHRSSADLSAYPLHRFEVPRHRERRT